MYLKFNASVPNADIAREFYSEFMEAKVIKGSDHSFSHQYVKLFGKISLHVHPKGNGEEQMGVHIIRFEDAETSEYLKAVALIKGAKNVSIKRDMHQYNWGTTLFRFTDPFGISWVYEINTDALEKAL